MQTQNGIQSLWSTIKELVVKHGFAITLLTPAFIYTAFFTVIIIFSLLQLSLSGADDGAFPTLANYSQIIYSSDFWDAFWRTVSFVALGTPLQLAAGLILAVVIHRKFMGRGIVRSIFLLPITIPCIVTAVIAAYMLFSYPFGHINDLLLGKHMLPQMVDKPVNWYTSPTTALGLSLITKVWRDMPISMLILLAGLQSISRDQYEAAQTMGASAVQQFAYITIPLLVPAISTVLVLRSIEVRRRLTAGP
jgi:ABC-type sugar transport system permease subunit